jgi:hypothetical protein
MALSAFKSRPWLADHPTFDIVLPVKATSVIYGGAFLELSGGCATPFSGAGDFCGVALESITGGATDGATNVKVRILGAIEVSVADTIAITSIAAANSIEVTDDDTLRLETGAAITGGAVGKLTRVIHPGASGTNRCVVAIKATALLP